MQSRFTRQPEKRIKKERKPLPNKILCVLKIEIFALKKCRLIFFNAFDLII
jgi:hypothetical protein